MKYRQAAKILLLCLIFPATILAGNLESKRQIQEIQNTFNESKISQHYQHRALILANRPSTHPASAIHARLNGISASFDFYIWRDGTGRIWTKVDPVTVEDVFICSPAFLLQQNEALYETVRLEDDSGFSQCGDVTETSIFQLTQHEFYDKKVDLNKAFTLHFDGAGEIYQRIEFPATYNNNSTPTIYFFNPASNNKQRSYLYVLNPSSTMAQVTISAIDDRGNAAPGGNVAFSLAANSAIEFSSADFEQGNPAKGLQGSFGDGTGKWRLSIQSNVTLGLKSILRTPQGYENDLSRVMPLEKGKMVLPYVNQHSSTEPHSFLRIINPTSQSGLVTITARDEAGAAAFGNIRFMLNAGESKQINSRDLEVGSVDKRLLGALGDGTGKWHLEIESALDLKVMLLIRTPDGFLSNFSD